jgi:hypothetical protein
MNLTKAEYILILKHYGIKVSHNQSFRKIKTDTHAILLTKLCRCIKAVQKKSRHKKSRAIAICNNSIFKKRGLKHFRFTCKKKQFYRKKGTRKILSKTIKGNLRFRRRH